jgi:hypothetical protein
VRERTVIANAPALPDTRLQTVALVLGILSLVPLWPLMVGAVIVGIMGIVKAKEPPARDVRWRPIVGLCVAGVSIVGWLTVLLGTLR